MRLKFTIFVLLVCTLLGISSTTIASDHADPIKLSNPLEPDLTGLFVFHDGDNLILILNTYRGLNFDAPYNLEPFEYRLLIDLHSDVGFTDKEKTARYGGNVQLSENIAADITFTLTLNNDASLNAYAVDGLQEQGVKVWSGVRDDPFIFPRFFGVNIISMVISIPFSNFPQDQQNWLVWASSHESDSGKQIDHVGRSNRTQLARLDHLNTLHPSKHVEYLQKESVKEKKIADILNKIFAPLASLDEIQFQIRPYDIQPDVLIYSNQFAVSFPNGRLLTDDIAALTCKWGDCDLQEVSYIEGVDFPRKTVNDKKFLTGFPYLAEPWPSQGHANNHAHSSRWWWVFILIFVLFVGWYQYRRKHAS